MKFFWQIVIILTLYSAGACDKEARQELPLQSSDSLIDPSPDTTIPKDKILFLDSALVEADEPRPKNNNPTQPLVWENYLIPQGQHYNSLRSLGLFPHDSLAFLVVFDSTVIYQTQSPSNQADWNKLMGFSDCGGHHHTNSVRVVWRYLPAAGGFQLGEYYYTNGNRNFSTLGNYQISDTIPIKIFTENGFYKIMAGNKTGQKLRACNSSFARYALFPYFGGDETAPHDINIFIRQTYP